jgi:hypothetical protein
MKDRVSGILSKNPECLIAAADRPISLIEIPVPESHAISLH